MSAPTADLSALRQLEQDWDSYGAVPISAEALRVAEAVAFVPLADGGIQIELHGGGVEIEIEISAAGRVSSILWEPAGRYNTSASTTPRGVGK